MHLTDLEKQMAAGDMGEGMAKAMNFLIALGEAFGAERMVEITCAHPTAVGYRSGGEGALQFLRWLADVGTKSMVPVTVDPIATDLTKGDTMKLPKEFYEKQATMNDSCRRMGFHLIFSCLPYWGSCAPRFGDRLAWSESNAVAYANSALGARTNREGGTTSIMAGIAGRIPEYGVLLSQNRRGQALIRVETPLEDMADWHALGAFTGKTVYDRIPVITGLGLRRVTNLQFKALCGGMTGPWGTMPMFHIPEVTPESRTLEEAFGGRIPANVETYIFDQKALRGTYDMMCTAIDSKVDLVTVGCPLLALEEVAILAAALEGKKIHPEVQFWAFTDEATRVNARRMGLEETIEKSGAYLLADCCMVTIPIEKSAYGFRTVVTDSAKAASYIPGLGKPDVYFGNRDKCIRAAVTGKWEG